MDNVRALYDSLLDSGELSSMFPQSKGVWEKDKKFFNIYYEENNKILSDIEDIDDEDEDFYTDY